MMSYNDVRESPHGVAMALVQTWIHGGALLCLSAIPQHFAAVHDA
jgi:hypothetical protein